MADLLYRCQPRRPDRGRRHPHADAPQRRHRCSSATPRSSTRTRSASPRRRRGRPRSTAANILVAVGTEPARPANVPFTPGRVIDSNELLDAHRAAQEHDHRRRRRHRHRIRLHARGRRREGDARRIAARGCSSSSTTRSPRRCSSACATWASACGSARSVAKIELADDGSVEATLASNKVAARRDAAVRHRPPGRDRQAEPRRRRPDRRQPRAAEGERALPDRASRTSTPPAT